MSNASQGGFVFHNEREPTHYAFVHIEKAGPAGSRLGDCVTQYAIWNLPKGSYEGLFAKGSEECKKFENNPEYRKIAVVISSA